MEETMCSLESDDCLLSTESLKEDSLSDTDMQSFLRAWARKCKQGTFSARVILLKKKTWSFNKLCHYVSELVCQLIRWSQLPVFWVNYGIDYRIVYGWWLGYNSWDGFGIRAENASISDGQRWNMIRDDHTYTVAWNALSKGLLLPATPCKPGSTKLFLHILALSANVSYLPSPCYEGDTCIGGPRKHKHYDDQKSNLG